MPEYRCTKCGKENRYSFTEQEERQIRNERGLGLRSKLPKTLRVPCTACGTRTVQNELGR